MVRNEGEGEKTILMLRVAVARACEKNVRRVADAQGTEDE
jgi:hypothetical protein